MLICHKCALAMNDSRVIRWLTVLLPHQKPAFYVGQEADFYVKGQMIAHDAFKDIAKAVCKQYWTLF